MVTRHRDDDGNVIGLSVPRWLEMIAKSQGLWAAVAVGSLVFILWYLLPQRGQAYADVERAIGNNATKLDRLQATMDDQTSRMNEAARMMHDAALIRNEHDQAVVNLLTQVCLQRVLAGSAAERACWDAMRGQPPRVTR